MKAKILVILLALLVVFCTNSYGQNQKYRKRGLGDEVTMRHVTNNPAPKHNRTSKQPKYATSSRYGKSTKVSKKREDAGEKADSEEAEANGPAKALAGDIGHGYSSGRVRGGRYGSHSVNAHSTDSYKMYFRGGEIAVVVVNGEGDTDLELYVYDESGNLICSDTDSTDGCCICSFTPRWSGTFIIKIVNLGSINSSYTIMTNKP